MSTQSTLFLIVIILQSTGTAIAQPEKQLSFGEQPIFRVSRTVEKIVVDGKMDEQMWTKTEARVFDNFYRADQPDDQQQSTFRMLWDDQNLYLFYEMRDKYLTARETERDGQPYFDDCAEIFLIPVPAALDTHIGYELNLSRPPTTSCSLTISIMEKTGF